MTAALDLLIEYADAHLDWRNQVGTRLRPVPRASPQRPDCPAGTGDTRRVRARPPVERPRMVLPHALAAHGRAVAACLAAAARRSCRGGILHPSLYRRRSRRRSAFPSPSQHASSMPAPVHCGIAASHLTRTGAAAAELRPRARGPLRVGQRLRRRAGPLHSDRRCHRDPRVQLVGAGAHWCAAAGIDAGSRHTHAQPHAHTHPTDG